MSDNTGNGVGFLGLLTIAFVVLRLCSVINWPWFWVLSPVLLPIIVLLIVAFIYITIAIWVGFFK
jgi:hypothetical protein